VSSVNLGLSEQRGHLCPIGIAQFGFSWVKVNWSFAIGHRYGPERDAGPNKGDFLLKSFTADHHHQPLHRQRCSILLPALPKHGAPSSALRRAWPAFPKELATPKSPCLFWRLAHISTISESRTISPSFATGIFPVFRVDPFLLLIVC
jgi:hypothetical protein